MRVLKIYLIAVAISFTLIVFLCIFFQQPLTFLPKRYGLIDFLLLFLLMGVLNIGLVFFILESLRFLNRKFLHINKSIAGFAYFGLPSLIILFIATLLFGFVESLGALGFHATPFYYYTFSDNSWIYLMSANITIMLVSLMYVKEDQAKSTKMA